MKLLVARLLLAALMAGQIAMLGVFQADTRRMTCCQSVPTREVTRHSHCPPVGATANSCCPDCPYLQQAMIPVETTDTLHANRPQVAIFPAVSMHANRRAERPPVPPPRWI